MAPFFGDEEPPIDQTSFWYMLQEPTRRRHPPGAPSRLYKNEATGEVTEYVYKTHIQAGRKRSLCGQFLGAYIRAVRRGQESTATCKSCQAIQRRRKRPQPNRQVVGRGRR